MQRDRKGRAERVVLLLATSAMFLAVMPFGGENGVMDQPPTIMPLEFVPARQVLAREDAGFTRWLSEHLEYLEPVLGLASMELVETESLVGSFFLDIRASGMDAQGQTVAVPIENQYGRTDHDHLGKLITYTAQAAATAERVLGV